MPGIDTSVLSDRELNDVLSYLRYMATRKVAAALPFLFFPPGIIVHDGKQYLNTSRVSPIPPAAPVTDDDVKPADIAAALCRAAGGAEHHGRGGSPSRARSSG